MSTRSRDGFTLLEVLAAVAVLALVYTALAQAAMQGLSHEGDASRRLHASLLADQALAEIEGQLAVGAAPPAGLTEAEQEEFAIRIEVRPFDLRLALQAGRRRRLPAGCGVERAARRPRSSSHQQPSSVAAPRIEIRVAWVEGFRAGGDAHDLRRARRGGRRHGPSPVPAAPPARGRARTGRGRRRDGGALRRGSGRRRDPMSGEDARRGPRPR
jgi:prepilin-type N-terminal cleavage/methylation domain-containing protein